MKKIFLLVGMGIASLVAFAQRTMTLDECIQYAIDHNIDIQRRIVQLRQQEIASNTSEHAWLPQVNAQIGEQFSFGNYNATTGSMDGKYSGVNNDLAYTTGNISVSMPLFDGFKIHNQAKADAFLLESVTADLEQARKNAGIQVATYYLQCLYYKSMADVARQQVETSKQMLQQTIAFVTDGKSPRSEQAEAEAKLAADEYALTEAEGHTVLARLQLSQLLNLPSMEDFDVVDYDGDASLILPPAQSVYEDAIENYPSILAAKSQIQANQYLQRVAQAGYYPTLSLQGHVNTFYVNMFHQDLGWGNFGTQFRHNMNEVVGLHLSIPIFNAFQTRNKIRRAKQQVIDSKLSLDQAYQTLHHEIHTASYNASVARKKMLSANKAMEAAQVSLGYEQCRYEEGRSSVFQLYQAQQDYVKSRQDAIQAKYEVLIRQRILQFYQHE